MVWSTLEDTRPAGKEIGLAPITGDYTVPHFVRCLRGGLGLIEQTALQQEAQRALLAQRPNHAPPCRALHPASLPCSAVGLHSRGR